MKKLIVAKFGGTSVADMQRRGCAIDRIKEFLDGGYAVAAVVSAMGRKGEPYATDTLLSLLPEGADAYTRDLMMSCGETISACVFADALARSGVPALPMSAVTAGIAAAGPHTDADISGMDTANVLAAMEAGLVPVITGFQGVGEGMRIYTLGRGGSDTSAAEIGGYLNAEAVYIYTDVDGVYDSDPRKNPGAKFLTEVDYDTMLYMAENGAGVVHPRAVKAAKKYNIPLWVRSTFGTGSGTVIK